MGRYIVIENNKFFGPPETVCVPVVNNCIIKNNVIFSSRASLLTEKERLEGLLRFARSATTIRERLDRINKILANK